MEWCDGPSPDVRDATPGEHVFHWISDTGSIELRWPAPATDVITGAAPDTSRKFFATDVGVFRDRACRVQTTVVGDTQAGMDRGFDLLAQLRAPLEPPPLIAASTDVAGRPDVIACESGLANRNASLQWVTAYTTPVEALKAFLDGESNSTLFAQSEYVELHAADGTVYFGYEATEPIGTSEDFNQLLIATRSSEGWAITAWETSGC